MSTEAKLPSSSRKTCPYGVEAGADDPNTIKTGPLKKKNVFAKRNRCGFGRLRWKMKYVEIRKGLFSYYENSKIQTQTLY